MGSMSMDDNESDKVLEQMQHTTTASTLLGLAESRVALTSEF